MPPLDGARVQVPTRYAPIEQDYRNASFMAVHVWCVVGNIHSYRKSAFCMIFLQLRIKRASDPKGVVTDFSKDTKILRTSVSSPRPLAILQSQWLTCPFQLQTAADAKGVEQMFIRQRSHEFTSADRRLLLFMLACAEHVWACSLLV